MMALNLRTLMTSRPYDHAVILIGRRHARRRSRLLRRSRRPMAAHFHFGELYIVQVSFRGGAAWNCPGRGPCGIHDLPAVSDQHRPTRLNELPPNERKARGFDAEIVLPRATPSPPARGDGEIDPSNCPEC